MSLIVNNVLDLKDGFNNFVKGTKSGPYQLFYFPNSTAEASNAKADLMKAFTTRPAFQWIELDGRAIIQESVSLTEAAQKIIGPNFKQRTTNQDVYQLHNAPTYGIIINNFDVARDAPEQNPLNLDQLKEIFGDTKIVIIYFHTVIADNQKSMYTEKVINKIVKTFDEDDSTCWSIITNQIALKDSAAIAANTAVAATARSASTVTAVAATPETAANVRAYIAGTNGSLATDLANSSLVSGLGAGSLSGNFEASKLITDIQNISGYGSLATSADVKSAVASMSTGANANTAFVPPYTTSDINAASAALNTAVSTATAAAQSAAATQTVANLIAALAGGTNATLFADGNVAGTPVSFSGVKANVGNYFSINTSFTTTGAVKGAVSGLSMILSANQITVLNNNIDTWLGSNPVTASSVPRSALESAINSITPVALKDAIKALNAYNSYSTASNLLSSVSGMQQPTGAARVNYSNSDIAIAAAAIQAQITANPASPAVPAASATSVINAAKNDTSNLANASAAFKKALATLVPASFGSAADAYSAILTLSKEYAPSTAAQRIITVLSQARDITVKLIDASDDLAALAEIQNMPKDKAFVLLLDNFDLASSLLNRELVKYRSMALSERLNASGGGYAVCQFMIAFPASNYYLAYEAK